MPIAVETTIHAIVFVVQLTPIGTNLGLARIMWAMVNGSFLQSRGAIFAALQNSGFEPAEIHQSWSALRYGSWRIDELVSDWQMYVARENQWRERRYERRKVVSIDITGFWRPRLKGWLGKHYHHMFGKALPAVVVGVVAISGEIGGRRIPILRAIVRCQPEMSEAAFRTWLLREAVARGQSDEVKVVDAGFKISELHEAGVKGYVIRAATNFTARRNRLPKYKGRGRRSIYGTKIRPLARKRLDKPIAATSPDQTSEFKYEKRTIRTAYWKELVLTDTPVSEDASTFSVYVFYDPHYTKPLVLVTDLELSPESVYLIYKDRWPVEQPPLAAKQMIGLHRQFVFAPEACFRLPELALLAGSILTYAAAVLPPVPSGFWDRKPQATPGRLRRLLGQAELPNLTAFDPQLRNKRSLSAHLPKGVAAHRRQKRAA